MIEQVIVRCGEVLAQGVRKPRFASVLIAKPTPRPSDSEPERERERYDEKRV